MLVGIKVPGKTKSLKQTFYHPLISVFFLQSTNISTLFSFIQCKSMSKQHFLCLSCVYTLKRFIFFLLPLPSHLIFAVLWPFECSQTLFVHMQCGCGARALKREWKQDITTRKYFWCVKQMDKLLSVHMSACISLCSFSLLSFFHSCPLKPPPFHDWWIIDSV